MFSYVIPALTRVGSSFSSSNVQLLLPLTTVLFVRCLMLWMSHIEPWMDITKVNLEPNYVSIKRSAVARTFVSYVSCVAPSSPLLTFLTTCRRLIESYDVFGGRKRTEALTHSQMRWPLCNPGPVSDLKRNWFLNIWHVRTLSNPPTSVPRRQHAFSLWPCQHPYVILSSLLSPCFP